ncbi:serine protease [Rhodanobacter panaciterrae]|uniref:Serine protease n=1 Tax=Rhodanobacter panaciterrae TaxID=490572 RepID=A0ABQ3A2B9_9GAMM|nr:serine protease [Rhodanobacter panaciterrae]GGY30261.1 serine protease [Rhodanobacter panaciterrae]
MHDLEVILRKTGTMRSAFRRLALLALIGLCGVTAHAASLDPAVLPKIQAATFEVVAAKPVNDPLTYEKPLPLELLPYQERNDKYYSIGTAFALGNNRYVTAAHVLQVGIDSLWGEPALRDAGGHVYAIGKIEKYSLQQDFVVFTLAEQPAAAAALEVNTKPALNEVVYAVGNALGTGVVIRDGLYTSDTPEDQDGRWKWMRFSAAASPGNSGGPLLDKDGKLIGIVLMKSANENLNYALPIGMILNAPDHLAVIDQRVPYQFDVFDTVLSNTLKTQFALPLSFADFSAAFQQRFNAYVDVQLKALLAKEPDKLFPRGAGSNQLLHSMPSMDDFPALITRDNDGTWSLAKKAGGNTTLPNNGYVTPGVVGRNLLFHIRKPDNVTSAQLYGDPSRMMDMLAKVGFLTRTIGPEKVRITSLGKPSQDTLYTDAWQRRWQVRVWPLPAENALVMTFALPVPDGYVVLMRIAGASQQHDYLINLQALTDFFFVTYDGTLAQWQEFLKNPALLPVAFKDIKIDIDYGHRFSYASKRVHLAFTPELQKIEPTSMLTLGFSYFTDHGNVVWDVGDVWLAASAHDQYWVNLSRTTAPSDDLDDSFKSDWNKIVNRQRPFDGVARSENDVMKITSVVGTPADAKQPSTLYTVYHYAEGAHSQAAMKSKLDLLMKGVRVDEH